MTVNYVRHNFSDLSFTIVELIAADLNAVGRNLLPAHPALIHKVCLVHATEVHVQQQ